MKKELECQKRRMVKVESSADYQIMLLQQQLVIVKRALSVTKGEARGVQRLLDREVSCLCPMSLCDVIGVSTLCFLSFVFINLNIGESSGILSHVILTH